MSLLSVRDLRTYFRTSTGILRAVDGVSFDIRENEVLSLVGETGCGKTMTALSIVNLVPYPGWIAGGSVVFRGRDLLRMGEAEIRKIRGKEIAMIFQNPSTSLNPVYTVGYQIAELPIYHLNLTLKKALDMAVDLIRSVRIPNAEIRARSHPHVLSGGMKQRSMIAMMIALSPSLLIADEPTTMLDVTIQTQITELLKSIQGERKMSILLISHNIGLVAEMSDRMAVMYCGRIVEIGHTADILKEPLHPYTKGLLHSMPIGVERRHALPSIPGMLPDPINVPAGCRFSARCPYRMDICEAREPNLIDLGNEHHTACFLHNGLS